MRIETRDFGLLDVESEHVIHFNRGIIAFESIKDYVLLDYDFTEESPIMCLQSMDGEVAFTVIDPFYFWNDYRPVLTAADYKQLGVKSDKVLRFLVMAAVGADFRDTVVNLRSPVVINMLNHQAAQIVLDDDRYPLRYRLFSENEDVKNGC